MRNGVLWAARFDARHRRVIGEPVPLQGGIAQAVTADNQLNTSGAGQFAVSRGGALAFIPGGIAPYPELAIVSVDRMGRVTSCRCLGRVIPRM